MWTALKSRVEAIAANDENNSDVNNDDSDSDNNTCRVEDTVQENKTLRVELFAAYNRLKDTQDNLIKAEALISLSDAEKNAKLHVAEEECAYQRALSAEHMKRAEELSQIVRNYERHNIKVNMELIERNALKKEAEQLRKTNKEVRADMTAKNRTIHGLQKEREQAAALVELQQSAASTSQTYQSTVKNNEDLARVNIGTGTVNQAYMQVCIYIQPYIAYAQMVDCRLFLFFSFLFYVLFHSNLGFHFTYRT